MTRIEVFALVALGATITAGGVAYIVDQKPGKKGKKKHGHHHAHEAKHHKKKLAGKILNPIAIGAGVGAAAMSAILYTPCACLANQTAVPATTPNALPAATAGTGTPSTTQSNFGPTSIT